MNIKSRWDGKLRDSNDGVLKAVRGVNLKLI